MATAMDTQVTEIFGRNRLVSDLLLGGVEVAMPFRDRGIDLIAYVDIDEQSGQFTAVPIQIKAATQRWFSIDRKYAKFPNLLLAFVWGVGRPETAMIYALTYAESLGVGKAMGWLETKSWIEKGLYTTTAPSERLLDLLSQYEVRHVITLGYVSQFGSHFPNATLPTIVCQPVALCPAWSSDERVTRSPVGPSIASYVSPFGSHFPNATLPAGIFLQSITFSAKCGNLALVVCGYSGHCVLSHLAVLTPTLPSVAGSLAARLPGDRSSRRPYRSASV